MGGNSSSEKVGRVGCILQSRFVFLGCFRKHLVDSKRTRNPQMSPNTLRFVLPSPEFLIQFSLSRFRNQKEFNAGPSSVQTNLPVSTSHTLIVLSSLPLAKNLPSKLKATELIFFA
jgi:hypothetical protein